MLDRSAARIARAASAHARAGCDELLLAQAKRTASDVGGGLTSGMLTLHCPPEQVHALATLLREKGAENVVVADLGYVFSRTNPLYAKLEAGLGPRR